jgi:hypothetical protein
LKFGHGKEHEKEEQIKDLPIARKREKKKIAINKFANVEVNKLYFIKVTLFLHH